MSFVQICLCLIVTCIVGGIGVFFVGHIVYAMALNRAIVVEQFVQNPLSGTENYGEAFAFLLNSLLYLGAGISIGVITTVQVARASHLGSSSVWWQTGVLTLVSACAAGLGAGLLLGLLTAANAYPHLRSASPPGGYTLSYFVLSICGLGLLGPTVMLPQLIGMLHSGR